MLEIIILIFLTRKIGETAIRKGEKPGTWKFVTVIAWIACEFAGILIASMLFDRGNLFALISIGIMSAFGGYLLIKYLLEKKPDQLNDDISNIGSGLQ